MKTASWLKRLETCPTISWGGSLTRCVNRNAYEKGKPRNLLFVSGIPNRCNPAGTLCIYMAEEQETALTEYNKYAIGSEPEPFLVFTAQLRARKVLDLADAKTCAYLRIAEEHLLKPFRLLKSPTRLQSLGLAIASQREIVGIRFPSAASHRINKTGHNFVLFKNSFLPPDRLEIQDPHSTTPDCWP